MAVGWAGSRTRCSKSWRAKRQWKGRGSGRRPASDERMRGASSTRSPATAGVSTARWTVRRKLSTWFGRKAWTGAPGSGGESADAGVRRPWGPAVGPPGNPGRGRGSPQPLPGGQEVGITGLDQLRQCPGSGPRETGFGGCPGVLDQLPLGGPLPTPLRGSPGQPGRPERRGTPQPLPLAALPKEGLDVTHPPRQGRPRGGGQRHPHRPLAPLHRVVGERGPRMHRTRGCSPSQRVTTRERWTATWSRRTAVTGSMAPKRGRR